MPKTVRTLIEYLASNDPHIKIQRTSYYLDKMNEPVVVRSNLLKRDGRSFIQRLLFAGDNLRSCILCHSELEYYYWYYLLLVSLFGIINSFHDLVRALRYAPRTYRGYQYKVISPKIRQCARILLTVLMISIYTSLLYGIVMAKLHLIQPWLVTYGLFGGIDFLVVFYEIAAGIDTLQTRTIGRFLMKAFNICVGHCLRQLILQNL